MVGSVVGHTSQTIQQYTADGTKDRPTAEVDRKESKSIFGKSVSYDIRTGANLTRARTSWAGFKRLMTNVFDKPWAATLGKLSKTAMARKEAREVRQAGYQLDKTVNQLVSNAANGKNQHPMIVNNTLDGLKAHADTLKKAGFSDKQIQNRIMTNMTESLDKLRAVDEKGYQTAVTRLENMFCVALTDNYRTFDITESEKAAAANLAALGEDGPDPARDYVRTLLPSFRGAILEHHIESGTMPADRMMGLVEATFGKQQREFMEGTLRMYPHQDGKVQPEAFRVLTDQFNKAAELYQKKGFAPGDVTVRSLVLNSHPEATAEFDIYSKQEGNFENIAWLRDVHDVQTNRQIMSTEQLRSKISQIVAGMDDSNSSSKNGLTDEDDAKDYCEGIINTSAKSRRYLRAEIQSTLGKEGPYSMADMRTDIETMDRDQLAHLADNLGDPLVLGAKMPCNGKEASVREVTKNMGDITARFIKS